MSETQVWRDGDTVFMSDEFGSVNFSDKEIEALRDFFARENDERLGRWRFSDDLVIYPKDKSHQPENNSRMVYVLDERTARYYERVENSPVLHDVGSRISRAARVYFKTHPEPKPWHDARLGEMWAVTWGGHETACLVVESAISSNGLVFCDTSRETPGVLAPCITNARRIWPEGE